MRKPSSAIAVDPQDASRHRAREQDRRRRRRPGRASARRRRAGRVRGRSGRGRPRRTATARAVARPQVRASRVGYSDPPNGLRAARPSARDPVQPPSPDPRPNVPTRQLEARLRRPGARDPRPSGASGGRSRGSAPRTPAARSWSFLDGPITANNPMGVHHAWGRAYKDLYQRFHAMLGEDQRYQNGFDCQGLWVEVNVERDLGFTSQARHRGVRDRRVRDAVQAARPDLRRPPDRAVDPARDVDGLERPGRAAPAARPARRGPGRGHDDRGPGRAPSPTPSRCSSGGSACRTSGGSYFTFSNENNDLIWGFLAECHRRGWLYKGHDTMPWCARCGTGISQTEMNEGYQDREDPGLTVRFPLARPAGRVAPRLDDDALDAHLERGRGGRAGPRATSRSARATTCSGSARAR